MSALHKAAQQALMALEKLSVWCPLYKDTKRAESAITALRTALAQQPEPAQEPVSWGVDWGSKGDQSCVSILKKHPNGVIEVVAVEYGPPQRPPLTDEEINEIAQTNLGDYRDGEWHLLFARAVERKVRGE